MTHEFGSNGRIVDAFIAHIKGMTPEQWDTVIAARDAAWYAARDAARDAARYAAGDAARYAARDAARYAARDAAWYAAWDAAGYAAGYAASEIQGADLMRERGQPFFFLPMFGFADERAIVQPATQAMSRCDKCGTEYPSAPAGTIHKCGACSGGYCSPIRPATQADDAGLVERLRSIGEVDWQQWPAPRVPNKLCAEAADLIKALRQEVQDLTDELAYHGVYPK